MGVFHSVDVGQVPGRSAAAVPAGIAVTPREVMLLDKRSCVLRLSKTKVGSCEPLTQREVRDGSRQRAGVPLLAGEHLQGRHQRPLPMCCAELCAPERWRFGYGTGARDMAWKPQGGDAGDSSWNTGDGVGALGMEMLRMALTLQHGDVVCGMETLGTAQGHWVWHGDSRWHKDTEGSTGTLRMAR